MLGPRAKRSLAQNFLVDANLQRKLVRTLETTPADTVLEVGPGHGELSQHLVDRVAHTVLVEKDDVLVEALRLRWRSRADVEVVHGDALEINLATLLPTRASYRILSNLPYNVASPLLFAFLELRPVPIRIVITLQREMAARLTAAPGSKDYGALSVGVQARATAKIAFRIGRQAFRPVPDVDSAVVSVVPDPMRLEQLPTGSLRRLTRAAFSRRRKQLQKILRDAPEYGLDRGEVGKLCDKMGLDPRARPETLSPEQFVALARALDEE